jgi:hypothetical protein
MLRTPRTRLSAIKFLARKIPRNAKLAAACAEKTLSGEKTANNA